MTVGLVTMSGAGRNPVRLDLPHFHGHTYGRMSQAFSLGLSGNGVLPGRDPCRSQVRFWVNQLLASSVETRIARRPVARVHAT